MEYSLACPDWEQRLRSGRVPMPDMPLYTERGARAVRAYNMLRLADVHGTPTLGEAGGDWFRSILAVLFGSLDPVTKRRAIRELLILVPKKNSKTTNGALMMLVALLLNERPRADFFMCAPVQDTAELAFSAVSGAIQLDPVLDRKFHIREHVKTIIHRETKAQLEIMTFDPAVVTGRKVSGGALVDELHEIAKGSKAAKSDELQKALKLRAEEEKQRDQFEDMVKDLDLEREALSLTNEQLAIRNNLLRAGITDPGSAEGLAIIAKTEDIERLQKFADTMDGVRGIAYDFMVTLPKDGKEAWKNLLADIESMLLQWAAKGLIDKVFGQAGTTGAGTGGGDWLSGIFSAFGGGGGGFDWGSAIGSLFGGGRANGGPVSAGKFYEVNENGWPELLTMNNRQLLMMPRGMSGHVSPMRQGGGMVRTGDTNIHVHGRMSRQTAHQAAMEAGRETMRALRRSGRSS